MLLIAWHEPVNEATNVDPHKACLGLQKFTRLIGDDCYAHVAAVQLAPGIQQAIAGSVGCLGQSEC
jgi:hypothetical protein